MRALEATAMSYSDYLALEQASETKHEYVNGLVYAMAGGTPEHARLAMQLGRLLGNALAGRPCSPFTSDLRVRIAATRRSTYPDLSVVCHELKRASDDPDAIVNPTLLAEVLSDSTEASDRGEKWAHYQRIESLQEYVLVSQRERRVEVFRRADEGWTYAAYHEGEVELRSLGVMLSIEALYHDPLASSAS
jgi:Uma2 family endonuclease